MAYEQKNDSASLFKNLKKADGSNQPDFTGQAMVDGVMKDASLWVKTDKNGNKWFSISFKEPYKKATQVAGDKDTSPRGKQNHFAEIDDDVAF